MAASITLQHLRDAHQARDPRFVDLLITLITQGKTDAPPKREGVYTFDDFLADQKTREFQQKPLNAKARFRIEKLQALEASDAEIPLPDHLKCHEVLMELWEAGDIYSRDTLRQAIAEAPLVYGPFKALKQIFKQAEENDDTEIYGALAARFDMALGSQDHRVSQRTLAYLARRAWRYLRRIGESFPAIYPDVATDFLIHYRGGGDFINSWILNHIFFHEMHMHARTRFRFAYYSYGPYKQRPQSWQTHRAFDELWRRSPRPLFTLLESAQADVVIRYATNALKSDFRAALRDVEPSWAARLIGARNEAIDGFVVWILDNVPRFEQSKFRELGLHESVLQLFYSSSSAAQKYAANYARTHARDLSVEQLIELANMPNGEVSKVAVDLLLSRDPRKEIGLDAWGELLETNAYGVAEEALRKHFGASELTPEWFVRRLSGASDTARRFAQERLTRLHSLKQLGWQYFADIVEQLDDRLPVHERSADFCCQQLEKLDVSEISTDKLRRLLMHRLSRQRVVHWVDEGKLKANAIGADFLKVVGYQPAYDADPLIAEMKQSAWGRRSLKFDEELAKAALGWLRDVRQFSADDLGFEWLLELVQRSEPLYHNFAVETMTKAFVPADFATEEEAELTEPADAEDEINVDLGGASFVFTGKLNTMTRGQAQGKVTAAGGANSNTVSKSLDYLVIGDEGSPLYGQGRKGSKQLKAEKLNADGAGIRIISETAFLRMLAGEQREVSEDATAAGCQRLWSMLCDTPQADAPLSRFARTYLRHHHPDICLEETDRPVDPGAEIPPNFLTFEQVAPLFHDRRAPLRELALEFAKWEFARWSPPIDGIVRMCESPYDEVREFVARAMTADDSVEHRRFRVDPGVLTADAVYSFCESRNQQTRALGMKLIDRHPRLQAPDELFRLTESPDSAVRAFVIRTFWSLYRDRGTTPGWKPKPPPETDAKKKKRKQPIEEIIGAGAPTRPESLPAEMDQLQALLRRILFEIPPGRPPKEDGSATDTMLRIKPLPARQAKLKLVDTLRDVALDDVEFARRVAPLLREFKQSRGKSERAACLVAVTRIEHCHGEALE